MAHSGLLEGKSVLELGAGIGMTGMAVAASCGAREVVLTDYAPKYVVIPRTTAVVPSVLVRSEGAQVRFLRPLDAVRLRPVLASEIADRPDARCTKPSDRRQPCFDNGTPRIPNTQPLSLSTSS